MTHQDFEYKEYPNAKEYPKEITLDWFKNQYKDHRKLIYKKETNIVSMGSCFANEIAKYFIDNGYNYPIYEKSEANFNCDWNLVFTPFHMNMIAQYSFQHLVVDKEDRWWPTDDPNKVRDPFRRNIIYNKNRCEADFSMHVVDSKTALISCNVLILTLGLIELWTYKYSSYPFYRVPPKKYFEEDPNKYRFSVKNYDDCFNALEMFITRVKRHNANGHSMKTILSVSPIPLHATFRTDVDIITANQYSKSVLKSVCNDLTDNYEVFYFPAYEYVLSQPNPFIEDNRHVKPKIKKDIFELFEYMYVKGEDNVQT